MLRLHVQGIAARSDTTVKGGARVTIANQRTWREDLSLLVRECVRIGREVA